MGIDRKNSETAFQGQFSAFALEIGDSAIPIADFRPNRLSSFIGSIPR
jgi:hypothetical protein